MRRKIGPCSPLEDLERRFIRASIRLAQEENKQNQNTEYQDTQLQQSPSMPSMVNNPAQPQQNEVASEPPTPRKFSTPQGEVVVERRPGSSRWPVQWRRRAKAANVQSSPVKIDGTAPSLPEVQTLSPLPDFEEGSFGEASPGGSPNRGESLKFDKPLPDIPLGDDGSDTDETLINEDVPYQDLLHDDPRRLLPSNMRPRPTSPVVHRRGAIRRVPPQQRYRANSNVARTREVAPRPQVARSQTTPPAQAATAGSSKLRIVRKLLPQTPGAPPVPQKADIKEQAAMEQPVSNFGASVRNSAMCHSPNCPIREPHLTGLYLHDNQRSMWRHPYWGISNPPPHIWQGWDHRTAKTASHHEVSDVLGFIQCHSFGRRGKSKEPATNQDYEEAKKLRGDKWVGGFF